MEYLVIRRRSGQVRALVFIGGATPFADGVLTLRLADCNAQDVAMKELASTTVNVPARPINDWLTVDLNFAWPERKYEFNLKRMSLRAEIHHAESGKLLYTTKINHPINLEDLLSNDTTSIVVLQPVSEVPAPPTTPQCLTIKPSPRYYYLL